MIQIRPISDLRNKFTEIENIETKLDEADSQSAESSNRLTHEEVFSELRAKL